MKGNAEQLAANTFHHYDDCFLFQNKPRFQSVHFERSAIASCHRPELMFQFQQSALRQLCILARSCNVMLEPSMPARN